MFYFFFNWGPPFYTQKGRADPTKRCLYCVFFRQGNPWSKPLCSSSYRSVHLPFCQIWFFICSFFEGAIMISFYLLSIFLSSYLVFLQCFCSIYVSFQHIDMLVFWLFCLCLPMLLLLCFFLFICPSFFSSICLCNYLFSLLLIYWYIYVSSHLPIIPIYMSMCLPSPPSSNLSSIILSTCRCVSCWCSFYRSIYLWFSFYVLSFHDSCLSNIDMFLVANMLLHIMKRKCNEPVFLVKNEFSWHVCLRGTGMSCFHTYVIAECCHYHWKLIIAQRKNIYVYV